MTSTVAQSIIRGGATVKINHLHSKGTYEAETAGANGSTCLTGAFTFDGYLVNSHTPKGNPTDKFPPIVVDILTNDFDMEIKKEYV